MRYFIHLAYKGTQYSGWQRQKSTNKTIQEILEFTFSKVLKSKITFIGCGRTDASVHAKQYFAHIETNAIFPENFLYIINRNLPDDIKVIDTIHIHASAHAQRDATQRTYEYHMHFTPDPFLNEFSVFIDKSKLDFKKMTKAVSFIEKQSDFLSMCKKPDQYATGHCKIYHTAINISSSKLCISITANRFLQSMMRLLIGRVIDIGIGTFTLEAFAYCFDHQQRASNHNLAPPQGLHLTKVSYPFFVPI